MSEDIAPYGDIILVVGEEKARGKLRVSSAVLTVQSPVFAAMLGPHFREGQGQASTQAPKEILLPDDPATAMSDLCNLLHLKTPAALMCPGAWSILKLAKAIDKYGCHEALTLQSQALLFRWLDAFPDLIEEDPLCHLAAAAYLLGHGSFFKIFTNRLMTIDTRPYSRLLKYDAGQIVSAPALLALEEKRTAAKHRMIEQLPRLGMPKCAQHCNNFDAKFMANLLAAFNRVEGIKAHKYWPPAFWSTTSISKAAEVLKRLGTVQCGGPSCTQSTTLKKKEVTHAEFEKLATDVEAMCEGLCLQCVKEGLDLTAKCSNKEHAS